MLTILYGRAGTGKTAYIMEDIRRRMTRGESGMLMIVPEQYSHDAERQLCALCGDSLSLHAEVLSFTGLCRSVFAETGGAAKQIINKSGQILLMHKTLENIRQELKVFLLRKTHTDMLESLLAAVREFKSMCITPGKLEEMAEEINKPLSDKLRDFALIMDTYDTLLRLYGADMEERLTLLAGMIPECTAGSTGHIYFDGFNDFTAQEMRIIAGLLEKGADITVCLTYPGDDGRAEGFDEIYEIPRRTAAQLSLLHSGSNPRAPEVKYICIDGNNDGSKPSNVAGELRFLREHLFDETAKRYPPGSESVSPPVYGTGFTPHPVTVFAAPSQYAQCEYAAAVILDMVHAGYRWRDIAVMARDITDYESMCGHVFEKYGIPYFSTGKTDIKNKAPAALMNYALEIATAGWDYKTVFGYLKTGLLQLTADEIAQLENYVLMWNIRGTYWLREWVLPPQGYNAGSKPQQSSGTDAQMLKELNIMREKITRPLIKLQNAIKGETPVSDKLRALYDYTADIALPQLLTKKAAGLKEHGQLKLADEYIQMYGIIIDAMDQMHTVTGDSVISETEFCKLFSLVLSQYDVGVIPVSLDRVLIGSMTMSRRRELKCLIIIGATDDNLPKISQGAGVLSDNERTALAKLNPGIPAGLEERLYREMNMLYSTVTLPDDKLVLMYETAHEVRPSFIIKRLRDMFGISENVLTGEQCSEMSEIPYMEHLNKNKSGGYSINRERLSQPAAQKLYGSDIALSATRADNYYSCPYKHFLQSGLRLQPRRKAQFDAASAGSFIHYILDGVFSELKTADKLHDADDKTLISVIDKYTDLYIAGVLYNFEGKNERFKYLFNHYRQGAVHIIRDIIGELKKSKFMPVEFEMDISRLSQAQRGFIDRVDKYETDDSLYLRVVDYKTRKKAYDFSLSDVLHGRDMQMLIYLFALEKYGKDLFGKEIHPAGVLYMPVRDNVLQAPRNAGDEEIEQIRQKDMKRSGLILDDPVVIEAMESGPDKRYLPLKTAKDGSFTGDSLVSAGRLKILSKHVEEKMKSAKEEILGGVNDCKPYYKSMNENACTYCEYPTVCRFDEQLGDKCKYIEKIKTQEVWDALAKG